MTVRTATREVTVPTATRVTVLTATRTVVTVLTATREVYSILFWELRRSFLDEQGPWLVVDPRLLAKNSTKLIALSLVGYWWTHKNTCQFTRIGTIFHPTTIFCYKEKSSI